MDVIFKSVMCSVCDRHGCNLETIELFPLDRQSFPLDERTFFLLFLSLIFKRVRAGCDLAWIRICILIKKYAHNRNPCLTKTMQETSN